MHSSPPHPKKYIYSERQAPSLQGAPARTVHAWVFHSKMSSFDKPQFPSPSNERAPLCKKSRKSGACPTRQTGSVQFLVRWLYWFGGGVRQAC